MTEFGPADGRPGSRPQETAGENPLGLLIESVIDDSGSSKSKD